MQIATLSSASSYFNNDSLQIMRDVLADAQDKTQMASIHPIPAHPLTTTGAAVPEPQRGRHSAQTGNNSSISPNNPISCRPSSSHAMQVLDALAASAPEQLRIQYFLSRAEQSWTDTPNQHHGYVDEKVHGRCIPSNPIILVICILHRSQSLIVTRIFHRHHIDRTFTPVGDPPHRGAQRRGARRRESGFTKEESASHRCRCWCAAQRASTTACSRASVTSASSAPTSRSSDAAVLAIRGWNDFTPAP